MRQRSEKSIRDVGVSYSFDIKRLLVDKTRTITPHELKQVIKTLNEILKY